MFPSTFRRLEVFVTIVEAGSFAGGAQRLNISQASVSDQIATLERQVGCALFVRRRGAVSTLTAQGQELYTEAAKLLAQGERIASHLAASRQARRRRKVIITAQPFIGESLLCRLSTVYKQSHEDIEIGLKIGGYQSIVNDLREGRADIGYFTSSGAVADLQSDVVGIQELAFFAAPGHPLAQAEAIAPGQLIQYQFVMAYRETRFGQTQANLLKAIGIPDVPVAYQCQGDSIIKELVSLGVGISLLFTSSAASAVEARRIVRLPVIAPRLEMQVREALSPRRPVGEATLDLSRFFRDQRAFGILSNAV